MTVKARDVRLTDVGGGLNLVVDWGSISDNQSQVLHNMRTNKTTIQSIEWYKSISHPFSSNIPNKGTIFSWEWVVMMGEPLNTELGDGFYAQPFNLTTWVSPLPTFINYSLSNSTVSWRGFGWNDLGTQYICIIGIYDTNGRAAWTPLVYRINSNGTMDNIPLSWISWAYGCGMYYEGRLILSWKNWAPWLVSFSQTASTASVDNFKNFWTPGFEQIVGEWDEIVTGLAVSSWKILALTKKAIYWGVVSSTKTQTGTSYTYNSATPPAVTSTTAQYTTSFQCVFEMVSSTWNVDAWSFVNVNHDLFFFDWSSIRRLGYEENISAIRDSSISDYIRPIFSSLPRQRKITANFVFPLVKFYFNKDSDVNDFAVVYNVMDKSFSTQRIGASDCGVLKIKDKYLNVWMSSFSSQVMECLPEGVSSYDGNPQREHFVWKDFSVYDDVDYKRYTQVELSGEATDWTNVEVNIYVDWRLIKTSEFIVEGDKSPTIGAVTFWVLSLGSNSPTNNLAWWTKRIELFHDGQTLTIEVKKNGNWFIRLFPCNYRFREVKAFPIH